MISASVLLDQSTLHTDQNVAIYVFGLLVKLCMPLCKLHDDCRTGVVDLFASI
jgi:hypothetical protein